jgi:hypothetical protein
MVKKLKFAEKFRKPILEGKKTATFRVFDDKNISEADELILISTETKDEFAKAIVSEVKETIFGQLTEKDYEGNEKYVSDEELFKEFEKYYHRKIDWNTPVKIIRFNIQ